MVQITPLLYAIPVISHFKPTGSTSNGLAARQSTIDPSTLPSACQSSCQVINTMANCAGDLTCECASSIGSQLQDCMNCLVKAEPTVESEAQAAISGWNEGCNGSLSLSTASSSSGGNGTSSNGTSSNGAVNIQIGSMAISVVAALAYAFVSF